MTKKLLLVLAFFISSFFIFQTKVLAAACSGVSGIPATLPPYEDGDTLTFTMDMSHYDQDKSYYIKVEQQNDAGDGPDQAQTRSFGLDGGDFSESNGDIEWSLSGSTLTVTVKDRGALTPNAGLNIGHTITLFRHSIPNPWETVCLIGAYDTPSTDLTGSCSVTVSQEGSSPGQTCYAGNGGCIAINKPVTVAVSGLEQSNSPYNGDVWFTLGAGGADVVKDQATTASGGSASITFTPQTGATHSITIKAKVAGKNEVFPNCSGSFNVEENCPEDECNETESPVVDPEAVGPDVFSLCSQIPDGDPGKALCISCAGGEEGTEGVWTAIGCINKDPQEIVKKFITSGLGIAGGIALLSFLAAGFIYSTSQGNAERTRAAREMMTSSIIGIIFVLLSVTMLQFIGWSIFKIPGFGG